MHELCPTSGVVLDLDDTLYPEIAFHISGIRSVARTAGLDPEGPEALAAICAFRSGRRPIDSLSDDTGIPAKTLLAWHRDHRPDIELYPDAQRFLMRLRAAHVPVVILTDGRSTTQRHKVEALGLRHLVDAVLISGETGLGKEGMGAFKNAAARIPPRFPIAYFGDNTTKDIDHPVSMGWQVFLMLDRGDNVHPQDLEKAQQLGVELVSTFDDVVVGYFTG